MLYDEENGFLTLNAALTFNYQYGFNLNAKQVIGREL